MVVTVSAWFYHFIFILKMPYQAFAIFLCHMCEDVLRSQIRGGRFPHVHYRVQGNSCKALQVVEAVICNEVFSDFKKFWKFCLIICNQKSSCGKNVKYLKESPERIDFAVILRLILLWLKIIGISVRDFAKPRLCICGMDEVSLPV